MSVILLFNIYLSVRNMLIKFRIHIFIDKIYLNLSNLSSNGKGILESLSQFENRIMHGVYIRNIMRSTMY